MMVKPRGEPIFDCTRKILSLLIYVSKDVTEQDESLIALHWRAHLCVLVC